MYKTAILSTLFVGLLIGSNSTEATTSQVSVFKGMNTLYGSPWDPRGGERANQSETADGQSKDELPLEQEADQ